MADGSNPSRVTNISFRSLHLMVRILDFHSNHRSSNLLGITIYKLIIRDDIKYPQWSISSVGRALPLQGRRQKFESSIDHHDL